MSLNTAEMELVSVVPRSPLVPGSGKATLTVGEELSEWLRRNAPKK